MMELTNHKEHLIFFIKDILQIYLNIYFLSCNILFIFSARSSYLNKVSLIVNKKKISLLTRVVIFG